LPYLQGINLQVKCLDEVFSIFWSSFYIFLISFFKEKEILHLLLKNGRISDLSYTYKDPIVEDKA
jgi:hypothetical protein